MRRSVRRTAIGITLAVAGALLAVGAPAQAHVTVAPEEAAGGSVAHLVFRMPTESDTASTTELEVHLPEETPIPSVRTRPVPGWSVEVERITLDEPVEGHHGEVFTEAVSVVRWTADDEDAAIQPGEYGEFPVELGPLPETGEVFFRALQTYSDGEVVRWIELPDDGEEPEFPAPSLRLAAGDSGHAHAPATSDESEEPAATIWLALAGLAAGLAGFALGGVAYVRTRRG